MRKHPRKGFTIVELVIVIGVIGILAAILIPTFIGITGKAQQASNESFVHNINTQLGIHESEPGGGKCATMQEAVEQADAIGFDLTKITPYNGNDIVWNQQTNRFLIVKSDFAEHKDQDHVVFVEGNFDLSTPTYYLWKVYDAMPTTQNYSIYANANKWDVSVATNKNITGLKVGFDVGNVPGIESIAFIGDGTTQLDARIRTGGTALTVNAPNATLKHYDFATSVDVNAISASTYHEHGSVGRMKYAAPAGKIRFEAGSVTYCYMNKSEDVHADVSETTKIGNAVVHSHVTSAGASTIYEDKTVTVTDNEVEVTSCHNHNADYDVVELNGEKYVICKCCGGYSQYIPNPSTGEYEKADLPSGVPVPEDFDYNPNPTNTIYGFYNSYVEEDHWVHEIKTASQFKNIMSHIAGKSPLSAEGYPLADKTTVYKILNDIDFGGRIWTNDEIADQEPFVGKLVSARETNIVLSNVTMIAKNNVIPGSSGWLAAGGLFNTATNALFKGITLDRFICEAPSGKGCGFFLAGNNDSIEGTSSLSFEKCIVNSNCIMRVSANTGGFVGSTRQINTVSFENCTNNAFIQCTQTNIGGFIGTGTDKASSGDNSLTFTNCTNNGDVMGSNFVGGFTGNTGHTDRTLSGSGNVQNAKVYTLSSGDKNYGHFFSGGGWYDFSNTSFSGSITSQAKLKVGKVEDGFELGKIGSSGFTISDANNVPLTTTTYENTIAHFQLVDLAPYFDGNNKLTFTNSVDCDRVVVNIRQHGLRINKTQWWPCAGGQTNEQGGPQASETHAYISSLEFDSLSSVDVTKVTQCGYFIPQGVNAPHASYDAGFETFLISDNSLLGTGDYTNGYHVKNGIGYMVIANDDPASEQYLAVCSWRNELYYEITAYKDGEIVANNSTILAWGRGEGDATNLLPISIA